MGLLLFNLFHCDFFLSTENNYFTNYADDATPYVIGNDAEEVVSKLKTIAEKLFIWFVQNKMKVDFDKCHLLLSTTEAFNFQISDSVIYNSLSRKLLGVTSQQTFADLRDVLKTSSRYVLKTYSTCLQRNNFSS